MGLFSKKKPNALKEQNVSYQEFVEGINTGRNTIKITSGVGFYVAQKNIRKGCLPIGLFVVAIGMIGALGGSMVSSSGFSSGLSVSEALIVSASKVLLALIGGLCLIGYSVLSRKFAERELLGKEPRLSLDERTAAYEQAVKQNALYSETWNR